MSLIDDIKKDREAGTPGPWSARTWNGDKWPDRRWSVGCDDNLGTCICICPLYANPADTKDARRIARVPDMEAALLAAEELAEQCESAFDGVDATGPSEFYRALAAYRKATGADQ